MKRRFALLFSFALAAAMIMSSTATASPILEPEPDKKKVKNPPRAVVKAPLVFEGLLKGATDGDAVVVEARIEPAYDPDNPPKTGVPIDYFDLPAGAVTVVDRTYEVRLDPAQVPDDYINEGGLVHFELTFIDVSANGLSWHGATGQIVDEGDGLFWAPADYDPALGRKTTIEAGTSPLNAAAPPTSEMPRENAVFERVERDLIQEYLPPEATDKTDAAVSTMKAATLAASGPAGECHWVNAFKEPWAVVGASWPVGSDKAKLHFSTSVKTGYGVAFTLAGSGGEWESGWTKSITDGWEQDFSYNKNPREYKAQIRYQKKNCYSPYSASYTGSKYVPTTALGYTKTKRLSSRPNFTNCGPVAVGSWSRSRSDGKEFKASGGVKVAGSLGVNLNVSRNYSQAGKLTYKVSANKRMCGNNAAAGVAGKVRERWGG